ARPGRRLPRPLQRGSHGERRRFWREGREAKLDHGARVSAGDRTSDYEFELPTESIAQYPVEPRDQSRLMVVDRASGRISHHHFHDLRELIPAGDALVLNATKVFRARLLGKRDSGAPAEVLLLRLVGEDRFEAMVSPGGKLRPGRVVHVAPGLDVEILEITERRTRIVHVSAAGGSVRAAIERHGHVPLPPTSSAPTPSVM